LNVVHTLNVVHLRVVPDDRRERAREEKRARVLDAAQRVLEREGLEGITMVGVADELDWAVGTIYGYVSSKAALVTALQGRAIDALQASFDTARSSWLEILAEDDLPPDLDALVQACAFGSFWASASVVLADEFELGRQLLSTRVTFLSAEDVKAVLPLVRRLFDQPARLLDRLVEEGVAEPGPAEERVLRWLASLNGILLLDHLAPVDRHLFRANHLARRLTEDLLVAWGAPRPLVEVAGSHVERLAAHGPMAPPPTGPGWD
jgi:AcrR family transcriptional regulator